MSIPRAPRYMARWVIHTGILFLWRVPFKIPLPRFWFARSKCLLLLVPGALGRLRRWSSITSTYSAFSSKICMSCGMRARLPSLSTCKRDRLRFFKRYTRISISVLRDVEQKAVCDQFKHSIRRLPSLQGLDLDLGERSIHSLAMMGHWTMRKEP
jgi:hypothetical protein